MCHCLAPSHTVSPVLHETVSVWGRSSIIASAFRHCRQCPHALVTALLRDKSGLHASERSTMSKPSAQGQQPPACQAVTAELCVLSEGSRKASSTLLATFSDCCHRLLRTRAAAAALRATRSVRTPATTMLARSHAMRCQRPGCRHAPRATVYATSECSRPLRRTSSSSRLAAHGWLALRLEEGAQPPCSSGTTATRAMPAAWTIAID
mmetsp:Transcript_68718/g.190213  ORF Transcript_68718/g.190213 Transcript_68718/m.190213 type:complete len:208 (-) Transcript_68718:40-663(-)